MSCLTCGASPCTHCCSVELTQCVYCCACAHYTRILRTNRGIVGATKLGYGVLATVCQELLLRIDTQEGIDDAVRSAAGRQLVRNYRAAKALVLREGLLKFMIAKDAVN
jgi:hypothetical protein